jgi:hypothetical protein
MEASAKPPVGVGAMKTTGVQQQQVPVYTDCVPFELLDSLALL